MSGHQVMTSTLGFFAAGLLGWPQDSEFYLVRRETGTEQMVDGVPRPETFLS
jgi:hypothetical protein